MSRPYENEAQEMVKRRLNFSGELLGLDAELWDYVIVHELLDFSEPNHGKLWKSLMQAHLGDYEALEARLAEQAHAARPFLKTVAITVAPHRSTPAAADLSRLRAGSPPRRQHPAPPPLASGSSGQG